MIIHWLGHAAFSLQTQPDATATRLCIDPHAPGVLGGRFQLPPIVGPFDAIVTTHSHEDHAAWRPSLGTEWMIDRDCRVTGLTLRFRGMAHDATHGTQMGWVRMVSIEDGQHRVVHAGDLGAYTRADIDWLRGTDVLLVPVGGTYTLDGPAAAAFTQAVQPKWVIPMHGKDPDIDLPLRPVSEFLAALGWDTVADDALDLSRPPATGSVLLLTHP